jgi:UDP-N-acetylmuramoyl-tripeptide--D-alanyl-D-alanine ligase
LLGSRDAIAREKKKIFGYFNGTQIAFIYESEDYEDLLSEGVPAKIVHFGPTQTRGFEGSEDLGLDGTIVYWEGLRIRFPLFGAHNLRNALASISVSAELGISKENIKEGLETVRPLFGRSQIIRGPVTVIQDCYNANPDSFQQVFDFISALPWPGRKIGVLGAMKELGEQSAEAHRLIGGQATACDFQGLFLFGEEMEEAYREIQDLAYRGAVYWMTDIESLRSDLRSYLREGDLLLIKGSRAAELERLMPELGQG